MGTISLSIPVAGQLNSTEDPKIATDLTTIQTSINGNLDGDNLSASSNQKLGLSDSSNTRRGSSIIATQQAASLAAYATLSTPDTVSGIVLPTNGIIWVMYSARFTATGAGTGNGLFMAPFFGATQAQWHDTTPGATGATGPLARSGNSATITNFEWTRATAAATSYGGAITLHGGFGNATSALSGSDVTTGMVAGGMVGFYAAGGTYTVSIKFYRDATYASAFSIQDRRLYVKAEAF